MRFVLASASPARLATLRAAGLRPDVVVSTVDEDAVGAAVTPDSVADLVQALAAAKAADVADRLDDDRATVVLGCDSLLDLDGEPLGKPGDAVTARQRWSRLAGRDAELHTGHRVLRIEQGTVVASADGVGSTTVRFAAPTPAELDAYLGSGEPLAVAGGFTIDGLGGWFVDGVAGDPHCVVGVSLPLLRRLLADVGVELSDLGWPATDPAPSA